MADETKTPVDAGATTTPDTLEETKPTFSSARGRMINRFSESEGNKPKTDDSKAEEDPKDKDADSTDGEEDPKAEEDPKVEEDPKAEEDLTDGELTPEEREYIAQVEAEQESEQKLLASVQAWASTLTPETAAWARTQAERRLQQAKRIKELEASSKTADPKLGDDAADPAKKAADIVNVPMPEIPKTVRTVANMSSSWEPKYDGRDVVRQFGLNPDEIPKQYADAFVHLISERNKAVANAAFFRSEASKAFSKRDDAKNKLWSNEWEQALAAAGIEVNDTTRELATSARELSIKNGRKRSIQSVIADMAERHPTVFVKTKDATTGVNTSGADIGSMQKKVEGGSEKEDEPEVRSPEPPQGVRRVNKQAVDTPKPPSAKTLASGRANFIQRASKLRPKY